MTVPATEGTNVASGTFTIPINFTITDDDIDEIEQSFALVAQLGPDVPDNFTCFQNQVGDTDCFGRKGATEIKIVDNDRKSSLKLLLQAFFEITSPRYGDRIHTEKADRI